MSISVRTLLDNTELNLKLIAGENGLDREISNPEVYRPALELCGYFGHFQFEGIQIFTSNEVHYLNDKIGDKTTTESVRRLFEYDIPCAIVTGEKNTPHVLIENAQETGVPLLITPIFNTTAVRQIEEYLDNEFAPEVSMHGVLVDVFGVGTLILGPSGVGKSECALELVSKGHRLVADDVVNIKCLAGYTLMGSGSPLIRHHIEIRGLGIVDISRIFGVGAVRTRKRISLVINLENWDETKEYDRFGIQEINCRILNIEIPSMIIPVKPGRNISTVIEVGALNQRLKRMGIFSAQNVSEKLVRITSKQTLDL